MLSQVRRNDFQSSKARSAVGKMRHVVEMNNNRQSEYFQTIAQAFLRRRGAPFFLSPRDLDIIGDWEKKHIPLSAVIEGIERAFENSHRRPQRGRVRGLIFCKKAVESAASQHRDRRTGRPETEIPRSVKWERVRGEVERFLSTLPPEESDLAAKFQEGLEHLASSGASEDRLEELDEEIDRILWDRSTPGERTEAKNKLLRDIGRKPPEDIRSAIRVRVIKERRDKSDVPYLSLFYY